MPGRISQETRANYSYKAATLTAWYVKNSLFDELEKIGDNEFKVTLPPKTATILNYLSERQFKDKNAPIPANEQEAEEARLVTAGTIASDIAMIKSLLTEARIAISEELEMALSAFRQVLLSLVSFYYYFGFKLHGVVL